MGREAGWVWVGLGDLGGFGRWVVGVVDSGARLNWARLTL